MVCSSTFISMFLCFHVFCVHINYIEISLTSIFVWYAQESAFLCSLVFKNTILKLSNSYNREHIYVDTLRRVHSVGFLLGRLIYIWTACLQTCTITIARLLLECQKIVISPICLFLELSLCFMFSCLANYLKWINFKLNVLIVCIQQMYRCKVHTHYIFSMRVHLTCCTFPTIWIRPLIEGRTMVTPTTFSPLVGDACHSDFCQTSERMLAEQGFELTTTGLKPASQPTELPVLFI